MLPAAWAFSSANCSTRGLLHEDVTTIMGTGLKGYLREPRPFKHAGEIQWRECAMRFV